MGHVTVADLPYRTGADAVGRDWCTMADRSVPAILDLDALDLTET